MPDLSLSINAARSQGPAVTPQDYYGTHMPIDIGKCVVTPVPVIIDRKCLI